MVPKYFILLGIILLMKTFSCEDSKFCMDISNEKKESIFREFDAIYRKYSYEMLLSKVVPDTSKALKVNDDLYRDKLNCKSALSAHLYKFNNATHLSERALCPWEFRIKIRANHTLPYKYPMHKKEAYCKCETCDARIRNVYKCMPVLVPMPCLIRLDTCGSDGYYQWIPNIEQISVACVCASNPIHSY